jgi:hypothetical protein
VKFAAIYNKRKPGTFDFNAICIKTNNTLMHQASTLGYVSMLELLHVKIVIKILNSEINSQFSTKIMKTKPLEI